MENRTMSFHHHQIAYVGLLAVLPESLTASGREAYTVDG